MFWKEWKIYGVVQGVGFRYFVRNVAKALGVRGFVRNDPDGGVTIVAGGNEEQLKAFKDRFIDGNGYSYVETIFEKELSEQDYKAFDIQY